MASVSVSSQVASERQPQSHIQKFWEQHFFFFISGICLESKEQKTSQVPKNKIKTVKMNIHTDRFLA